MIKIHQIYTNNSYRNFNYIIEYDNNAIVIDPFYPEQILKILNDKQIKLTHIINTHEHFDHIAGNEELKSSTNAKICAHKNAKFSGIDVYLKEGDVIELNHNSYLKVMNTPGHTFAHLCLLVVNNGKEVGIITGDTLFNAGVGNCHNGGDKEVLADTSFNRFKNLPGEILVYPGHDYMDNNCKFTLNYDEGNKFVKPVLKKYFEFLDKGEYYVTTMGEEKKINLFLKSKSKEEFIKLRDLRDRW